MLVALAGVLLAMACAPTAAPAPQAAAPAGGSASAPVAATPAPITIRYGLSGIGGATTVMRLMNQRNIWAEEGLRAEYTEFQASPMVATAVIAGELDFGSGGAEAAVNAALKGIDMRVIGVYQNKFEYHLVGSKDMRSIQDLRGKAVGVARFGSNPDFATRVLLRRNGIDPERDVTILQVGNTPDRVAALQAGGIQAALLSPDALPIMTREGYPDLADMSKTDILYPFQAVTTSRAFMEKNPGAAERYLRAIYRGIKLFRDEPALAQQALAAQSAEMDKETLQALWETYRNAFTTDLTPDPQTFTLLIEVLAQESPEMANAAPDRYIDLGPIQRVNATGFPQQLFGTR
jgi:NitT/TauT family transport system substrate-binding protein